MPDITLCTNTDCPNKSTCYRFNAQPTPEMQSYQRFEPVPMMDKYGDIIGTDCEFYLTMPKTNENKM